MWRRDRMKSNADPLSGYQNPGADAELSMLK